MTDFIEPEAQVGSDALARIATLAELLKVQQRAVEALEEQLRDAKEALRATETEDLPELMTELGLTEIKLLDGSKVEVKPDLHCGISEERRAAAHAWLTNHGFGGLIKTEVAVKFDRDERDMAVDAAQRIAETLDRNVELKDAVHPATLKAFLKEQLALGADGANPPADLFGITPYNKAKITAPRAAAPRRGKS